MTRYLMNWFIWLDQGINMLCDGNADVTVSSRCGYFSHKTADRYWRFLESFIDWGFYPIDGEGHCWQAYEADPNEEFREGGKVAKFFLAACVLFWLPILALLIRIYKITR